MYHFEQLLLVYEIRLTHVITNDLHVFFMPNMALTLKLAAHG